MLRDGALVAAAGITVGAAASVAGARMLRALLFEVSFTSPLIYAGAALVVLASAAAATLVPALRASQVDPMRALRYE